jgi:hypothetical protein
MSRDWGLESPLWAVLVGSGIGVKLRHAVMKERQHSSRDWHNRPIRMGLPSHRYLPGHGTRTTDFHDRRHRFRAA